MYKLNERQLFLRLYFYSRDVNFVAEFIDPVGEIKPASKRGV
jgi:hypothetical protein